MNLLCTDSAPIAGWRSTGLLALVALLFAASCGVRPTASTGEPVADPVGLEAHLRRETLPDSPRQGVFLWSLVEQGTRVRGRGAVRFEAPERLRLDLFGPRGETYLAAALVGDDFRVPRTATETISLPSPALLWAALGVIQPPMEAELAAATASDSTATLDYQAGKDRYQFHVREDGAGVRLVRVERIGSSGVLESVRLEYDASGQLASTHYRDWAAYRDLELNVETIKDVPSFSESIWSPGTARP